MFKMFRRNRGSRQPATSFSTGLRLEELEQRSLPSSTFAHFPVIDQVPPIEFRKMSIHIPTRGSSAHSTIGHVQTAGAHAHTVAVVTVSSTHHGLR
jgi:hypothetical protein